MATEKRKVFVDYTSIDTINMNTPYRSKTFSVKNIRAFNLNDLTQVGDLIDLRNLAIQKSDKLPTPPFFAYISITDTEDTFRGKALCVVVQIGQDRYDAICQLTLGESQLVEATIPV